MLSMQLLGVVAYLDNKDNSKRNFTQAGCTLQCKYLTLKGNNLQGNSKMYFR